MEKLTEGLHKKYGKLSAAQWEVVARMEAGWELASNSYSNHNWLQVGGAGSGGDTYEVRSQVVEALLRKGVVKTAGRKFSAFTHVFILA